MVERSEIEKQLITFLRNLSGGFSSYRMFGGDTQQPGFVEAVRRIATSAEHVLLGGSARVGVHGERFIADAGALPDDDGYRRLALACYERRVEELALTAIPSSDDLVSLYIVLTTATDQIEELGGARQLLTSRGVQSIRLNEAVVSPTTMPDVPEALIQDALSLGLGRLDQISHELSIDPHHMDANAVYSLLREVVAALPDEQANDLDTYKRLREALENLPDEVRTSLSSLLVNNVGREGVAERIIGTMTDTGLARMLVDVSRETGSDPMKLARELVIGGFRRHDLIELAAAAVEDPESRGAGQGVLQGGKADRSALLDAIGEIISTELHEHADADEQSIRADYPHTEAEVTKEALTTFADYLRVDDDSDRMSSVLESWARATRTALAEDRAAFAVQLIKVSDHAYQSMKADFPERAALLAEAKTKIVNEDLIADLMEQGSHEETSALIEMFGGDAVNVLLQRLATEEVGARRSLLIGVISNLIQGHKSILRRWIRDKRWFVVRNIMTIVLRSGSSMQMLDVIDVGIDHPHPAVRKEATRALGPVGADALPRLLVLATDAEREVALAATDVMGSVAVTAAKGDLEMFGEVVKTADFDDVRERALELLAASPSNEATHVLLSIARFGSKPRAPWAVRRKAKALARQRRRQQG